MKALVLLKEQTNFSVVAKKDGVWWLNFYPAYCSFRWPGIVLTAVVR